MMLDPIRMGAYERALKRVVTPGCTVADLGTGTGVFALLACQYGASHVYAIEPNDAISVAREIAAANGLSDRITFIRGLSTEVELPQKVDVVVSDLRGTLPLFEQHLPSVIDARRRLLKPGGALIPECDRLWAAPVENAELNRTFVGPWEQGRYGLNMNAARDLVTNTWTNSRIGQKQFLAPPCQWVEIDYGTIEEAGFQREVLWEINRPGVMHGFGMWFDTTLIRDVGYSSLSAERATAYGTAFFPFSEAVDTVPGQRVVVSLRADLDGADYRWTWRTRVFSCEEPQALQVSFTQSTFKSIPLSSSLLKHRESTFTPGLSTEGLIASETLKLMQEGHTLDSITREIRTRFPGHFLTFQQASSHVAAFAEKFGQHD